MQSLQKKLPKYCGIFLFFISVFLLSPFLIATSAQTTNSNCVITQIGNPPKNQQLPAGCAGGGFVNPFPNGWASNRLDNGYDGTFKTKVVAPFSGRIIYVCTGGCGWGGSYFVLRSDTSIPEIPTSNVYFSEGINPTVHFNQHVNAGETIGTPAVNGFNCGVGCIEWGVAAKGTGSSNVYIKTYAQSLGSGHCPNWTKASREEVHTFYNWAKQNFHFANPLPTYGQGDCAGAS